MVTARRTIKSVLLPVLLVVAIFGAMIPSNVMAVVTNPITVGGVTLTFGDINNPTPPESLMSFDLVSGTTTTYHATYTGTDSADFYPNVLYLSATPDTAIGNLTGNGPVGTGVSIATYDTSGVKTTWTTITPAQNINNGVRSDGYTIEIGTSGGTLTVYATDGTTIVATINFDAPKNNYTPADPGTTPDVANGYLIGPSQYAANTSWGSISTNGQNTLTPSTGSVKIITGYSASGFSLGSLGGYAQFKFDDPVENDDTNAYGVDFIIYGNAFSGNPEAAIVQVAQDENKDGNPDKWYELAGSLYYDSVTTRNETVTYTLQNSGTNNGVYISRNGGAATQFTPNVNWWPNYSSLNHGVTSNSASSTGPVNILGYTYVDYPSSNDTITYYNLTEIPFYSTTASYQFGYADVHVNGSNYGTAVNPYTITASGSGGDGYDISWAVDIATHEPKYLDSISFVRVYSAVSRNGGAVGETSPELTGIYTTANKTGGVATTNPTVVDSSGTSITPPNLGVQTITVTAGVASTYYIVSAAPNVYVNSQAVNASSGYALTVTLASGQTAYYRVITQNGTESPYVTLLKFVA
jgi:hypothetical protein